MGWKFYRIWSTDWFRNKSIEQLRLLQAAEDAIKNPISVENVQTGSDPAETFEELTVENHFEFPSYQAADIPKLSRKYLPRDFQGMIRAILEVEAPLSEELLLKRIVKCFRHEKVTNVVQDQYNRLMYGCRSRGIVRKNGFLYLDGDAKIRFRGPGDIVRDIKQISPEELAAGMLEILKQNVTAEKSGLYRFLATQCGISRVGKTVNEIMESALHTLAGTVVINGDQISLK